MLSPPILLFLGPQNEQNHVLATLCVVTDATYSTQSQFVYEIFIHFIVYVKVMQAKSMIGRHKSDNYTSWIWLHLHVPMIFSQVCLLICGIAALVIPLHPLPKVQFLFRILIFCVSPMSLANTIARLFHLELINIVLQI